MHAKGERPAPPVPRTPAAPRPASSGPVTKSAPPPPPPQEPDVDVLSDALVLLAMSTGGGDVAIQQATQKLARQRNIPLAEAMLVVNRAKLDMTATGRVRKAMDPETQAYLIGATRARILAILSIALQKDNFAKGGASLAGKLIQQLAVLDGCPVDGMVQIVGEIKHEHAHRVVDPEREAIARAILERLQLSRPAPRVLDAEVMG